MEDKRFAHVGKDPRFRSLQKNHRKVKIDKRFQGMFEDERFKLKYSVDKRGRPVKTTTNENLQKYYELTSEESDDSETVYTPESTDRDCPTYENENKTKKEVRIKKKEKHISKLSQKNELSINKKKSLNNKNSHGNNAENTYSQKDRDLNDHDNDRSSESEHDSTENDTKSVSEEVKDSIDHRKSSIDEKESGSDVGTDSSDESEGDSNSDGEVDYARGAMIMESSSEEEQESTDVSADEDEDEFDHKWGEIDKEASEAEEITSRLALCNIDWDRIKANDLMVLLNSFKPSGGNIKSICIYPSEFGKERMKEEEVKGPSEIVDNKKENTNKQKNEGSEYHTEKLRQYQLNRLKYYYAVIDCDSAETANYIYEQCDGMEYETTGNRLDLRFIPSGMTFDDEPKSVATDVPDAATYKPSTYLSTALQQSNVQCTWDETDQDRIALTMRKFDKDDLEEMDLKDYLASDSDVEEENPYGDLVDNAEFGEVDSDSEGEEAQIEKYRNLLKNLGGTGEKEDKDMEMEVTWEPGLKETTVELVKKKHKEKTLTPWEQYLEKKKDKKKKKKGLKKSEIKTSEYNEEESNSDSDIPSDVDLNDPYFKEEFKNINTGSDKKTEKKKKRRKKLSLEELKEKEEREAELKLLLMDDDDQRQHFNLKQLMETDKIKKKRKKAKKHDAETALIGDNFKLDMEDPRFNVLFENPHYNIDPSAPEFKKTRAMDCLIEEKLKRKKNKEKRKKGIDKNKRGPEDVNRESDNDTVSNAKKTKLIDKDIELASLVKSVKSRTKMVKNKRKL